MTICSRRTGSAFTHDGLERHLDPVVRRLARGDPGHARPHALAEVHALPLEDDLAGHDPADVEEIVDEAGHVHGLPVDDVAREHRARLAERRQAEHLHRAFDGAERIAQLVGEHGEKLVLRLALPLHFRQRA